MKIKCIGIIFLLLCLLSVDSMAQEKKKISLLRGKDKVIIENVDSIKLVVDSLQKSILLRDSLHRDNVKIIDSLRQSAKKDSLKFSVANKRQVDSLLLIIRSKDEELNELRAHSGFVDTCMVKLANRWLYQPFDKNEVEEAISYFDRIYSNKLKDEMSVVQDLLRNYERSYREFQSIIKKAQNDIDRQSPFAPSEDYKRKYIKEIETMTYYWRYYKEAWNIKYLNEQIDKALEILKNHTADKPADFSSLIDSRF